MHKAAFQPPLSRFAPAQVTQRIDENFSTTLSYLKELVAFPGVSAEGFRSPALLNSAQWLVQACRRAGFAQVELFELPEAAPYLIAQLPSSRPNAPTILLYAHYDVQPIGKKSLWKTPPFEAKEKEGRLFGRGTADDKAGVMACLAAVEAVTQTGTDLPVNIRLLLDGEEERGSPHMQAFLQSKSSLLKADALIIPDMVNPAVDQPCVVFSLRGLVEFRVKISALKRAIHSGLGGGVVPDPTQALAVLYNRLIDAKGRVRIPALRSPSRRLSPSVLRALRGLKIKSEDFGVIPGVRLLRPKPKDHYEAVWFSPALTLVGMEIGEKGRFANQIQDDIEAVFSLRLPPEVKPTSVKAFLKRTFTKNLPYGCRGEIEFVHEGQGFFTDPEAPAFQRALAAVSAAHGKPAVPYGAGLTIPFVHLLQTELGRMKTVLLGIEDPHSNAHSENESMDLKLFRASILSLANLFWALP